MRKNKKAVVIRKGLFKYGGRVAWSEEKRLARGRKLVIAIDGTSGSGKSTLAQALAGRLGYKYIDTGAMYRMIAYLALNNNIKDSREITKLAEETEISLPKLKTKKIRLPEVTAFVSTVAAIKGVRKQMVKRQRQLAKGGGVIAEGRDIGTVVFPRADIKFFLVAEVKARARRRYRELKQKGIKAKRKGVFEGMIKRDTRDSSRKVSPLRAAPDAIIIDTSNLTIVGKNRMVWKHIIKKFAQKTG